MTGSTKPNKTPILVGVAGGSGSGKTYFAVELKKRLGSECEIVNQDNFYIDQSAQFDFDGGSVNFDHPESIDFDLLAEKLGELKAGRTVEIPIYDFATHSRLTKSLRVTPKAVMLVDGILIFHSEKVRSFFDELIFFDTPEDLRFKRRLDRDVLERGRTVEGVRQQFFKQVKPMHDRFVEPSKKFATQVLKETGDFESVLASYVSRWQS